MPARGALSWASRLVPGIPSRTGRVWIIGISTPALMSFDSSVSEELLSAVHDEGRENWTVSFPP